jgi:hypothetical protein
MVIFNWHHWGILIGSAHFGAVANDCGNLHTVGGLPEPVNDCPPEVNR